MAEQILTQKRFTKRKIHSLHAPEVECIATNPNDTMGVLVAWSRARVAVLQRRQFRGVELPPLHPRDLLDNLTSGSLKPCRAWP